MIADLGLKRRKAEFGIRKGGREQGAVDIALSSGGPRRGRGDLTFLAFHGEIAASASGLLAKTASWSAVSLNRV